MIHPRPSFPSRQRFQLLRGTLSALTTTWAATGTTRATLALRTLWTNLLRRQLSVAVLVERLQRRGGIRDFLLVNRAILVRIERGHQWPAHHALTTTRARTTLTALARRSIATGALRFILRQRERRRNAERKRSQQERL